MVFSKKRSHSLRYSPLKPGSSGVFFWSSISCGLPRSWPAEKMLAGASQDDHPHRLVVDRAQEGVVELFQQDAALRVLKTSGRLVVIFSTGPVRSVSSVV